MKSRRVFDRKSLAAYLGYEQDSGAMDKWLSDTLGVSSLPGRRGCYDRAAIDAALDRISKIGAQDGGSADPYFEWKSRDNAA